VSNSRNVAGPKRLVAAAAKRADAMNGKMASGKKSRKIEYLPPFSGKRVSQVVGMVAVCRLTAL